MSSDPKTTKEKIAKIEKKALAFLRGDWEIDIPVKRALRKIRLEKKAKNTSDQD